MDDPLTLSGPESTIGMERNLEKEGEAEKGIKVAGGCGGGRE
jgi:hypothetical protein